MMAFYIVVCFSKDVNFEELARCTDDFNGAQCKAVCVEAVRLLFAIYLSFQYVLLLTSLALGYDSLAA